MNIFNAKITLIVIFTQHELFAPALSAAASFHSPPTSLELKRRKCSNDNTNKMIIKPRATQLYGWFDSIFPKIDDESYSSDSDRQKLYPEQYPATYDLLQPSESLPGDVESEAATVRPLLKQTQLEKRAVTVVYDAERDGWSATSFHRAVDGKGAAVVLAETEDGSTVGGYNPKGWASYGGGRPSVAAFLFYGAPSSFQKLQKVGGGGLACSRDEPDFGVSFGPDGLVIGLQAGREQWAQSKLGTYYERGPEELSSLFESTGGGSQLVNLKVLAGKYEEGEEIPYSGAVFDMTSG